MTKSEMTENLVQEIHQLMLDTDQLHARILQLCFKIKRSSEYNGEMKASISEAAKDIEYAVEELTDAEERAEEIESEE